VNSGRLLLEEIQHQTGRVHVVRGLPGNKDGHIPASGPGMAIAGHSQNPWMQIMSDKLWVNFGLRSL